MPEPDRRKLFATSKYGSIDSTRSKYYRTFYRAWLSGAGETEMAYAFDSNRKIRALRATLRAQTARDEWTARVANMFGDAAEQPARSMRKPRVTFCASCGAPIYASATVVLGIAVDSTHVCQVAS
jgi:hypothetical protein